ncbi:MAG: hypothetical protein LBS59_07975 [Puniceicoccales bacterium]|jgi:hypothetical protein|nr:hypothetical protein [Puniceicoccales bacterium]
MKNTNAILVLSLVLSVPAVMRAQAPLPAAGGAPAASASNITNAGTAGDYRSTTTETMSDRIWDTKSDSLDFENGTFQWKGRTFNLGNSRAMRARLERYFATPAPAGDIRQYEAILRQIEDLLSPGKITNANYAFNIQRAWELLYEAAKFEADADNCLTIAALVQKTARMRDERRDLQLTRNIHYSEKNERLRDKTRHESTRELREDEASGASVSIATKGKTTTKSTRPPKTGTAESARHNEMLAEKRAELLRDEKEISTIGLRSRLEFQSQIAAFLLERRFRHTLIANAFYRQLYSGRAQDMRIGNKQVKEMFPVSDFVPTIDSLDMLAREAIKDVDTGVKAILSLYNNGERFGAFERIQETFFLGEHEPAIVALDPEKKRVLKEVWSSARDLQRMGDERDLAGCEETITKLKALASDFPAASITSKINAARQSSDLELLAAENAVLAKDTNGAKAHLERATKIWPANPGVKDFAKRVRDHANQLGQRIPEFDRLIAEDNLRSIYNRKEEFGLALLQDKERREKLQTIISNLARIDLALSTARALKKQENIYPAWDVIEEASQYGNTDPELGKARSELSAAASNYASLLAETKRYEQSNNYAAALTALLSAQDLNPGSEFCRQGIQRISLLLVEQEHPNLAP